MSNGIDPCHYHRAGAEVVWYLEQWDHISLNYDVGTEDVHPDVEAMYYFALLDALCDLVGEASAQRGTGVSSLTARRDVRSRLEELNLLDAESITNDLAQLQADATQLADECWPIIEAVAAELERNPEIDESDLHTMIDELWNHRDVASAYAIAAQTMILHHLGATVEMIGDAVNGTSAHDGVTNEDVHPERPYDKAMKARKSVMECDTFYDQYEAVFRNVQAVMIAYADGLASDRDLLAAMIRAENIVDLASGPIPMDARPDFNQQAKVLMMQTAAGEQAVLRGTQTNRTDRLGRFAALQALSRIERDVDVALARFDATFSMAIYLVDTCWPAIHQITQVILDEGQIDRDKFREIVDELVAD